jgi:hypothetical protein
MREPSVWRRPAISSIRSRLNLSSRASPTDPALREKESESRDLVFAERDLAIDWQNSPERHRQSQPTRGPSTRLAAQARLALAQDDIRWNAYSVHAHEGDTGQLALKVGGVWLAVLRVSSTA